MSQTQKNSIQELREETEMLRAQVEKLQRRLQSQQKVAAETNDNVDVWNVWPYSWAQSGWSSTESFCLNRFHSFHGKLVLWRLARRNHKMRLAFSQNAPTTGLKLV